MGNMNEIRSALVNHLCEVGELIRRGDDFYEDMGGHIIGDSMLDSYISEYMSNLSDEERTELVFNTGGG